jgi:ketosteroid isomerase-like protein
MKPFLLLLSACVMVAVAQNALAASGDDEIAQVRKEWVANFNAGKVDALAAMYMADAVLLNGKGERFEGPAAIVAYLKTIHGQTSNLKLTVDKFGSSGDLGYDSGSFQNAVTTGGTVMGGRAVVGGKAVMGGGGGTRKVEGNFAVILKKDHGKWLIVEQISIEKPPTP